MSANLEPSEFANNIVDYQDPINDEEFKPQTNGANTKKRVRNKYKWSITSYTPCSRTCGEGEDFRLNWLIFQDFIPRIVLTRPSREF